MEAILPLLILVIWAVALLRRVLRDERPSRGKLQPGGRNESPASPDASPSLAASKKGEPERAPSNRCERV